MLEFKINPNKDDIEYGEVLMWDVAVDKNSETITGFTDVSSFSDSDSEIYIEFDKSGRLIKHDMKSYVVEVNGSAFIDVEFRVEESENGKFVRYANGNIYYVEYLDDGQNGLKMCIRVNGEVILINKRKKLKKGVKGDFFEEYYGFSEKREVFVINDTITINGNTYEVIADKNLMFTVYPIDSDVPVVGNIFDARKMRLVTIYKNSDIRITPYLCNNCDNIYYFEAPSNKKFGEYTKYCLENTDSGYTCVVNDIYGDLKYGECVYELKDLDNPEVVNKTACCIVDDGVERPCYYVSNEYVNCEYDTDTIFLGIKDTNKILVEDDIIIAKNLYGDSIECPILVEKKDDEQDIKYVVYKGSKYYEDFGNERDFLEEFLDSDETSVTVKRYPVLRETFDDENVFLGKFYNGGRGISISVSGSGYTIIEECFDSPFIFKEGTTRIGKYTKFIIDGQIYYADEDDAFITIYEKEEIRLIVEGVEKPGLYICREYGHQSVSLLKTLVENIDDYEFTYLNKTLPLKYNEISFFTDSTRIMLPIMFTVNNSVKFNRDDSLNSFVSDEIDRRINRIVDMEKDVYYPAFCGEEGVSLINELSFKLHFRTRDLAGWKINEDYVSIYEMPIEDRDRGFNKKTLCCNWNIIDYYYDDRNGIKAEISPDQEHVSGQTEIDYYKEHITKYCQPADLLYFLNFKDTDILYQKKKIKKSFLRLLFYDSTNPNTQNLLSTETMYFDAGGLYRNYLENVEPDTHDDYGFINITNGEYTEYTGVDREPFYTEGDGIWTYREDFRIDASFNVKGWYEDKKSSSGYYLYLFKEFSDETHPHDIYMKIQFNHAGTGRVINFMLPKKIDADGNEDLVDITNYNEREEFKKGYGLSEIQNQVYTKLTVKYDPTLKKYVYCLPLYLRNDDDKGRVIFNLYEVKLKDESKESDE